MILVCHTDSFKHTARDRPKAVHALSIFLALQKFYPVVITSSLFYFMMGPFGAVVRVLTGQPTAMGYIMANMVFWGASTMALAFLVHRWNDKTDNQKVTHVLFFAFVFMVFAGIAQLI